MRERLLARSSQNSNISPHSVGGDGEPLNDFDAPSYYMIIATAGHDTTSSSIAGGLEALLRHPDQLARLRDVPALGANAVEEMIRWMTPVKKFMRTATEAMGGAQPARDDARARHR